LLAQMFASALARQRADEALRESEFQLDKAQRIARIGHFIWDEIEGVCSFRSAVLDGIVGLVRGEPVRSLQDFLDRIHPDDRQRFTNSFTTAAADVDLWEVQYRVVHPDGQVRNVHQVSSPEFDESGRLIRTVGTIQDITEMKLVEEKLRKSEELFSQAELVGGMGHWEWDETNERIITCSEQFARIHEMTVDEVLARFSGREYERDVVHPDDLEHYRRCTHEYRQPGNGTDFNFEYRIVTPSGKVRHIHMIGELELDDQSTVIRSFGTQQDVTERKATESELVKHQKQLQRLSSELSLAEERERRSIATELHDSVVQTLTLAKIKLGELRKRMARSEPETRIEEVRELLDQSLRESRSLISEISPPMLYELGLEPALEWLADHFEARHDLILKVKVDLPAKPLSRSIEVFVYQAVRELLLNIIKHAQANRASVVLSQKDGQVNLVVKDDGVGCDSNEIGLQVTNSGGFGLFNLRERVGFLGGHLTIESDGGTRVSLWLPLDSDENR